MRNSLWISFFALMLAAPASAERASTRYDGATNTLVQPSRPETAQERCDALATAARKAEKAWLDEYRKMASEAKESGESFPAFSWNDSPLKEYIPQFKALAAEYAGTDDAICFHVWLFSSAGIVDSDAAKESLDTLISTHLKSEKLEPLADSLGNLEESVGKRRATEVLALLEAESTVPRIRGWATYLRLIDELEAAKLGSESYETLKSQVLAASELAQDKRLSSVLSMKLRIMETFGIGQVAPDVEGIDLDGVAFKLSDYRGKVLFVDFWGDW